MLAYVTFLVRYFVALIESTSKMEILYIYD